jgi:Lrp/AsnC family transcriptional regulator, leucine-responsive regulatory protein
VDDTDRALVRVLLADARASYQDLARAVHLSATSVADRVRRLLASGTITGFHARVGLPALGRTLVAHTDVRLRDDLDRAEFEERLSEVGQVVGAAHITGAYDYQLELACRDTDDLERAVAALRDRGARELHSRIVLRAIPLDPGRVLD